MGETAGTVADTTAGAAGDVASGRVPADPGTSPGDWLLAPPGDVLKVVALSVAAFAAVALFFRLAGTRAAGRMNNFDWIVTVAQGAIVGSVALGANTSLVEGVAAVLSLLAMQYALNWVSVRSPGFRKAVFTSPVLLFHGGDYLRDAMKAARVSEDEVRGAVRGAGVASWEDVGAVVLEPGGEFSVLKKADGNAADDDLLTGVTGANGGPDADG